MKSDKIRVELVPLDKVKRAPRNPKDHDLGAIVESIKRFGFVAPLIRDEKTGALVAGHGRADALEAMRKAGDKEPEGIGAGWLVPVLCGKAFRSEREAEAYLLADNRLTDLGGWNDNALAELLKDLAKTGDLTATGYTGDDLDDLLKELGQQDSRDADAVPEPPKTPVTKPGDLWEMGAHRLLCGDSTKAKDVVRVMGKDHAMLMATDPPYGVAYDNTARPHPGVAKPCVAKPRIANDDLVGGPEMQSFLEQMLKAGLPFMEKHAAFYFWHPMLTQGIYVAAAAAAAGILIHRQIIWVKAGMLLGHGDYHWRHELCFYGWVQGNRPPFYGSRNQDTVWEIASVGNAERKAMNHATPKPVELWDAPIRNHTKPGEVLYEPFCGSGPQIIAAEKTGRKCMAIEITPAYVDVAIERWQTFTGGKAKRIPSR